MYTHTTQTPTITQTCPASAPAAARPPVSSEPRSPPPPRRSSRPLPPRRPPCPWPGARAGGRPPRRQPGPRRPFVRFVCYGLDERVPFSWKIEQLKRTQVPSSQHRHPHNRSIRITYQRLGVRVRGKEGPLQDVEVHGLVLRQGLLEAQPEVDGNLFGVGVVGWGFGGWCGWVGWKGAVCGQVSTRGTAIHPSIAYRTPHLQPPTHQLPLVMPISP